MAIALSRALLWSLAATGLIGALVVWLRPVLPFWPGDGWGAVVVSGLLLVAISALLTVARAPTLQETAVGLDKCLKLRQTLSTARESTGPTGADPSEDYVKLELWRTAERAIAKLRAASLVPFRPGMKEIVPLLVLAASFALAGAITPLQPSPAKAVAGEADIAAISPAQAEEVSDDLERLAASLTAEALRDRSQYLEAISQAAGDLAERIRGGAVDGQTAARELQTILDYLQAEIGSRLSVPAQADVRSPATVTLTPPSAPPGRLDAASMASVAERLSAVTDSLEQVQAARIGSEFETFYPQPGRADSDRPANSSLLAAEGEAGGVAKGVAQQSTSNEGDAAGRGTQDLMTGDPDGAADFQDQDQVLLPRSGDGAEGPRVGALTGAEEGASSPSTSNGQAGGGAAEVAGGSSPEPRDRLPSVRDESGGWRADDLSPDAVRLASVLLEPRSQTQ